MVHEPLCIRHHVARRHSQTIHQTGSSPKTSGEGSAIGLRILPGSIVWEGAMSTPPPKDILRLLTEWRDGNPGALDQLWPVVHGELHRLAKRYMRQERSGHTLQTTGLVGEAYL